MYSSYNLSLLLFLLSPGICVPYLEVGWTLWLLRWIVDGWSDTVWLVQLDRDDAALLFWDACPWNLTTMLWGSPSCPLRGHMKRTWSHEPTSLAGLSSSRQNQHASRARQATQKQIPQLPTEPPPMKLQRAKRSHLHHVLSNRQFLRKRNNGCCFKPLSFGIVCYASSLPISTCPPSWCHKFKKLQNWHNRAIIYSVQFKDSI